MFQKAKQNLYEGGTFNTILNEADKSRILFSLINNCKRFSSKYYG